METILNEEDAHENCVPYDGGPALPFCTPDGFMVSGMTLRDYFAAQALQGMLVSHILKLDPTAARNFAKTSYLYADAMLIARG